MFKEIVDADEETFAVQLGKVTVEEWEVFKQMWRRQQRLNAKEQLEMEEDENETDEVTVQTVDAAEIEVETENFTKSGAVTVTPA